VDGLDVEVKLIDGILDLEGDLPRLAQPEQEELGGAAAALAVRTADQGLQVGQLPAQGSNLVVNAVNKFGVFYRNSPKFSGFQSVRIRAELLFINSKNLKIKNQEKYVKTR
jgi:hypothetical protein